MYQTQDNVDAVSALEMQIAGQVQAMARSDAWQYMKRDMDLYIEQLQADINTVGNNEMVYTGKDLKILELKLLQEILNYPQTYLERIVMKRHKPEQFDAFSDDEPEEDIL